MNIDRTVVASFYVTDGYYWYQPALLLLLPLLLLLLMLGLTAAAITVRCGVRFGGA